MGIQAKLQQIGGVCISGKSCPLSPPEQAARAPLRLYPLRGRYDWNSAKGEGKGAKSKILAAWNGKEWLKEIDSKAGLVGVFVAETPFYAESAEPEMDKATKLHLETALRHSERQATGKLFVPRLNRHVERLQTFLTSMRVAKSALGTAAREVCFGERASGTCA